MKGSVYNEGLPANIVAKKNERHFGRSILFSVALDKHLFVLRGIFALCSASPAKERAYASRQAGDDAGHLPDRRDHRSVHDFRRLLRSEEHTSELQSLRHIVCR